MVPREARTCGRETRQFSAISGIVPPRLLRPPRQSGPPPGPQQVPELAVAMRGLVGTATRDLVDVRIVMRVARGNADVWNQALAEGRGAMRSAAAHLDWERCAAVWPQRRK